MKNDIADKRALAEAIIETSDAMPDPEVHLLWLLGLSERSLRERLNIIKSERAENPYRERKPSPLPAAVAA